MRVLTPSLEEDEEEEIPRSVALKRPKTGISPYFTTIKSYSSSSCDHHNGNAPPGLLFLELNKRARHAGLVKAAERSGWELTESRTKGHLIWSDTSWTVSIFYHPLQRFNHFPGVNELSRKDLLAKNLRRMREKFPSDYDIFPDTWILPMEADEWKKHSESYGGVPFYIVKPWNGSEGQGISLTQVPHVVASYLSPQVAQVYVQDPLTIDGFKLDLRIYVLITSVCPLRMYMYSEGLTRFATVPYVKANKDNLSNHYLHLTNYTINKESSRYSRDELQGSKRRFSTLNKQLEARGVDVAALWRRIDAAIVKCVLAALPKLQALYDRKHKAGYPVVPACFELLGFDVLLTKDLRPLVLEVNFLPSLHINTAIDQAVKVPMLADVLNMVNPNSSTLRRLIRETQKFSFQLFQSKFASKKATSFTSTSSPEAENVRELWESFCEEKIKEVAEFEMSQKGRFRRIYPPEEGPSLVGDQELTTEKILDFLIYASSGEGVGTSSSQTRTLSRSGTCRVVSTSRELKTAVKSSQELPTLAPNSDDSRQSKLERNGSMPDVTESTPSFHGGRACMRHSLRRAAMVKQASLPAMNGRTSSCGSSSLCSLSSCGSFNSSSGVSSASSSMSTSILSLGFVPAPISEKEETDRLDALTRRSQLVAGLRVRERLRFLKKELERPTYKIPANFVHMKLRLAGTDAGVNPKPPCPIGIKPMELSRRPPPPPRNDSRRRKPTSVVAGKRGKVETK